MEVIGFVRHLLRSLVVLFICAGAIGAVESTAPDVREMAIVIVNRGGNSDAVAQAKQYLDLANVRNWTYQTIQGETREHRDAYQSLEMRNGEPWVKFKSKHMVPLRRLSENDRIVVSHLEELQTQVRRSFDAIPLGVAPALPEARRGYIVFLAEHGLPHAAALLMYENEIRWIGFRSIIPHRPIGPGMIDDSSRQEMIESYVRFPVDTDVLRRAEMRSRQKYAALVYVLGVNDCVNLTADLARDCGLRVPDRGNFLPEQFVKRLARDNQDLVDSHNVRPFPWMKNQQITNTPVTITVQWVMCHKPQSIPLRDNVSLRVYCSDGQMVLPDTRRILRAGESWQPQLSLSTFRGHAVAIQVWDHDEIGGDDLVFDWSISTTPPVPSWNTQVRGTPSAGSESKYQVFIDTK